MSDNKQTNKRSHLLFLSLFFCHLSENRNKQPVHLPPRSFSRLISFFIYFISHSTLLSAAVCAFVRERVRVTNVPTRYRKFSRQLKSLPSSLPQLSSSSSSCSCISSSSSSSSPSSPLFRRTSTQTCVFVFCVVAPVRD